MRGTIPRGWAVVRVAASADGVNALVFSVDCEDTDAGRPVSRIELVQERKVHEIWIHSWMEPRSLSMRQEAPGVVAISELVVLQPSGFRVLARAARRYISARDGSSRSTSRRLLESLVRRWRKGGWRAVRQAFYYQLHLPPAASHTPPSSRPGPRAAGSDPRRIYERIERMGRVLSHGGVESEPAEALDALDFASLLPPAVSVIVITLNQVALTAACLESLGRANRSVPFELIVVDNASSDDTRRLLRERIRGARVVLNEENRYFAEACNQGASIARGRALVFLNNDTLVNPAFLESLLETADSHDRIGAVGAKLLRPDGRLQEAGSILWRDGSALGYGRGDEPGRDEYMFRRDVDYASAACLLVKRDVFSSLGGFCDSYRPAYYEDTDLCMKIRKAGYRVVFDPFAEVTHSEYGTSGPERAEEWMRVNRERFKEKWSEELERQAIARPHQRVEVLRARSSGGSGFILVIDERIPAFDRGGGYPRMFQMISCLIELRYHVTLACTEKTSAAAAHVQELRKLGVEVLAQEKADSRLADGGALYDVVLLSRPRVFAAYHEVVRRHASRARVLYDSEALWHRRVAAEAGLTRYPLVDYPGAPSKADLDEEAKKLLKSETEALRAADAVIAVTEDEARRMTCLGGRGRVFTIPTIHEGAKFGPDVRGFEARDGILLVGGFFDDMRNPNTDAALYFVLEILPRIQERLPHVELQVAGCQPPAILRDVVGRSATFWGDPSVAALRALYFRARVAVAPQRFGSGVKHKVTEAMSLGLPLVASTAGAEGSGLVNGHSAYIADDPASFADGVVALYTRADLWLQFATRAHELALARFCRSAVIKEIDVMMSEVMHR
jgi:GT2 family glycosyltransferase